MKHSFHSASLLLLLLFLMCSSITLSARLITTQQGQNVEMVDVTAGESSVSDLEDSDSFTKLMMGMENCSSGDEECLKRRMTMEAHLDYIYTQHHKH